MAEKQPELVGKKKFVVDSDAYFAAPRDENDKLSIITQETINDAVYFNHVGDKVRVVLGKNWDFRESENGKLAFSNNWTAPKVFRDHSLNYEVCPPPQFNDEMTLEDQSVREKYKIVFSANTDNIDDNYPAERLKRWIYYTKTGVVDQQTDTTYSPIVKVDEEFTDHYHESINPFTPAQLNSKQPTGKAFFANYKTYYNERLDSSNFEKATGVLSGVPNPVQNSLPSMYGFLKLFTNNKLNQEGLFSLFPIVEEMQKYSGFNATPGSAEQQSVYTNLLKKYPLEALVTLFGYMGNWPPNKPQQHSKILERIISLSFDKFDADSLFADYFNEYVAQMPPSGPSIDQVVLEKSMTNLVFSPRVLKLLNKVDQYKKHFPFYAELEFTAKLDTELGDTMKKMFLTKFMSEVILNTVTPPSSIANYTDSWTTTGAQDFVLFAQDTDLGDLSTSADDTIASANLSSKELKFVPLLQTLNKWQTEENGVYKGEQQPFAGEDFSDGDLRNYMSMFRDGSAEPINLDSDENVIFKKLFGSAFKAKILQTYIDNARSYGDILEGVPAYTEDLFYRIEKIRILPNGQEDIVQNILIPNTSELDIVKYVDTQLKYATYSTYRYHVYAHRAVFGSKYRYQWLDSQGQPEPTPAARTLTTIVVPPLSSEGMQVVEHVDLDGPIGDQNGIHENLVANKIQYTALFNTVVEPSIVLLEDKIFSTPEILILDKPPVVPDINILPYRAVNNRLKILMTGASDRYRQTPTIILDSDVEAFDRIKRAQLVVDDFGNPLEDGKVEFGSDDPVKRFQIFRIAEKPSTYRDFSLYEEVNGEVFEEAILPNTKYYYTFRAIDSHGHISNPSPVYEVELIDEKGAVKPIIRLFDMTPPKNKINTKACQKYIYLKPSIQQLYFADDENVDSIFSDATTKKKYKLRLTSKGSGKKIDINFSFKKEIKN